MTYDRSALCRSLTWRRRSSARTSGSSRGVFHEALRQYVLNRLPRFGGDESEINEIARAEPAHYAACFEGKQTHYGGAFWPMIFGVGTTLP